MIIKFTPQRNDDDLIYSVAGDVLTVTHKKEDNEISDNFDFSGLPDGELETSSIVTSLPVNPILKAVKENGQLTVTVLNWYNKEENPDRADEVY